MTTGCRDLVSLVEKLRQEQEFSLFYKTQIRQTIQDINRHCDRVFQSLWLSQCLAYGLEKVRLHHTQCIEWTWALEQVGYVQFVDAVKVLKSSLLIENYNKFLGSLLNDPALLAQVLVWAESEGLNSTTLISDLISVVYGHCVFQHDHTLFLGLLKELLRHLVSRAESPKELFSGVEPIFCRVLTEYCNQLVDLQTFLTEAFQLPLAETFLCEDYLEFDVNKAGTRFQSSIGSTDGHLLDGSAFLFGEDLDSSCDHLAKMAMQFIDGIRCLADQFPPSLKWVLASLKSLVRKKWPYISAVELRRPVSSVLFGPILGSTVVNPDSHGVCDMEVVISPVARYNLSQVASVLQGCAWVMERRGEKFPMQKVIKKMNTKSYCDLLDSLDSGYNTELLLDLPSSLPGLKRSVYLTSQTQLNNLVGLVCEMADTLVRKSDPSPMCDRLRDLKTQIPHPMKQLASTTPYSPHTLFPSTPRAPQPQRSDTVDIALGGKLNTTRKRVSVNVGKSPVKSNKKRSSSTSNLNQILLGGSSSSGTRTATRSISPNQMLNTHSDGVTCSPPGGQIPPGNFQVPSEVLILPISKDSTTISSSQQNTALWDFALFSLDEYMQHHRTPSFKRINSTITPPSNSTLHTLTPHTLTTLHTPTPSNEILTSSVSPQTMSSSEPDLLAPEPQPLSSSGRIPGCPPPIPEIPNGPTTDGMEPGQTNHRPRNGTGSISSPVRERWVGRSDGSHTRTGMGQLRSGGSDSSLSVCMSSREPSSSPQTIPKKRSFTVTSIENGKFVLNNDLSPVLSRTQKSDLELPPLASPPPCSPSPVHIITTTPPPTLPPPTSPPLTSPPPLANGVAYADKLLTPTPIRESGSKCISNRAHHTDSPNEAHFIPLLCRNRKNMPDSLSPSKHELSPSNPDLSASDLDQPSSDAGSEIPTMMGSSVENLIDEIPTMIGSSVENLIDDEATIRKGGKGKRKWFKRRKKDKKMKSQMSLQEEAKKVEVEIKPRSQSDFGITDQEEAKPRSQSQDELESTILDKYTRLVEEQKKMETPLVKENPLEVSLPRCDSVRVKEMDPQTFRHSLFCNQLEYKLRAALQNVHTPLTSSPIYHQLRADEDSKCDSKYQLTLLLQSALQRCKWFHDAMEIALLTETLKMVEQLPNELVDVALERTHKEQEKRVAYTNYLVQSHMKFQDVQLQVGAMQTTVDRRQAVLKEQFVQLAVRQFLDSQAGKLEQLRCEMVALSLADERCSLMAERLEVFTDMLLEDQTWRYWPREGMEMVSNYLEDQLFSFVYHLVFQPNMDLDKQKDEIFSAHLSTLSKGLTPTHRSLQISPIYHSGCPWLSAQKHLKAMSLFKSPRGKVHCIAESCRVLISLLQYAKVGSPPGADDLFPVLVYVLIKANPPGLLSTTQYIKNFLEDQLAGEENYWWVQFNTAVEFTKTLE